MSRLFCRSGKRARLSERTRSPSWRSARRAAVPLVDGAGGGGAAVGGGFTAVARGSIIRVIPASEACGVGPGQIGEPSLVLWQRCQSIPGHFERLQDQHRVTVAEEPILVRDRFVVSPADELVASECADED